MASYVRKLHTRSSSPHTPPIREEKQRGMVANARSVVRTLEIRVGTSPAASPLSLPRPKRVHSESRTVPSLGYLFLAVVLRQMMAFLERRAQLGNLSNLSIYASSAQCALRLTVFFQTALSPSLFFISWHQLPMLASSCSILIHQLEF